MIEPIKVLFLSAEASPFIKIGGLGDVAGTLPAALQDLPKAPEIRVVIPLHGAIDRSEFNLEPVTTLSITHQDGPIEAEVFRTAVAGVQFFLIGGAPFGPNEPVYTPDTLHDGHKFTFFSVAALELVKHLGWKPDVVHAQDWHAAPAIHALKTRYKDDPFFNHTGTLLTVHNMPYLGHEAGRAMKGFGLPPAKNSGELPKWARIMPLPLGLLQADKINTVSPGYAKEILTKQQGIGLERFLRSRQDDLVGILNGLDLVRWDPRTDPDIPFNYGLTTLDSRQQNKTLLLKELGLKEDPTIPLIAFIGRMEGQKGLDIAVKALRKIKRLPWQAVLLGTGIPEIEAQAIKLAKDLPGRVSTVIRYDDGLARRIYAGADMILIPSRYEPCGLIQMIAMRYGCLPVAVATGGLQDTIINYPTHPGATGFLAKKPAVGQVVDALKRALTTFKQETVWQNLQQEGMGQNYSWENSARQYYTLYQNILTDL